MTAEEAIDFRIKPLNPSDTIKTAKARISDSESSFWPVVLDNKYLGMVSEGQFPSSGKGVVSGLELHNKDVFVFGGNHFFEILRISKDKELPIIPILGIDETYLGCSTIQYSSVLFTSQFATELPGAVFVLIVPKTHYSLADISRHVESNGAKVLSSYVESEHNDPHRIRVTIKINHPELANILPTLERFGYHIAEKYSFIKEESVEETRLNQLLKYLEL
jgi:acetoin utilization protein AcuB